MPKRQLFRQRQYAVLIGIERVDVLGELAVFRIRHGDELCIARIVKDMAPLFVHPVDLERRIGQQDGLSCFLIDLGDAQVNLQFLVQYRIFLIAFAWDLHSALGISHAGLGIALVRRVNGHDKGLRLEHIFRHSGLHHKVLPIRQALHTDRSRVVREYLRQLVFIRTASWHPALAAAVLEIARLCQRGIVCLDLARVCLIRFGDGLRLAAEIVLGAALIVFRVEIRFQNARKDILPAACGGKLILPAQVRDEEEGKARALEVEAVRTARAGYMFGQFHIAFHDLVLRLGQFVVAVEMHIGAIFRRVALLTLCLPVIGKSSFLDIPALVRIRRGDVVVMLITEIAFGVTLIIPVVGFRAVQRLALADGRPLVFVHIVGVPPLSIHGQRGAAAVRLLRFAVNGGIVPRQLIGAVLHRDSHARAALHNVVFAEIEIAESQPAVFDLGAGHQMVFLQHRQMIAMPYAGVVADGGVPDGHTIRIGDFAVIHNAAHAVRVLDILSGIKVIDRTVQPRIRMGLPAGHGVAVRIAAVYIPPSVQVHLGN